MFSYNRGFMAEHALTIAPGRAGTGLSERELRSLVRSAAPTDEVMVEERVAALSTRSIKREAKMWALRAAISMTDLTTLEGMDTKDKVRQLCHKAIRPDPTDPSIPSVAAVCVYPNLVSTAVEALGAGAVKVAAVSTYFPSGQAPLDLKVAETRRVVADGADEVDMVIDRGAFLAGNYMKVFAEVAAVREAAGEACLKVILETGELGSYDNVRKASVLAMAGGADFIKTSTGKVSPAATPAVTLVMLEAIRDFHRNTGRAVGMKPAGGIGSAKQAIRWLVLLNETLGPEWMNPQRFRFGASSLLNDLLMQIRWLETERYQSPDYFTRA